MRLRVGEAHIKPTAFFACVIVCTAWAQQPTGAGAAGSNRAIPLPLSGRTNQPGVVDAQQSSGGDTVTSSVQITGSYQGSVPASNVPDGAITLTLADAVQRGLKFNLGTISADASTRAARAERIQALSALMPNISADVSETVTQVNLAAYGLQIKVPGFNFPTVVGPYSYSQLQGALSESVYDPVQRRNLRASRESERASILSAKNSRELVVLAVAGMYLQTVAAGSRVLSQRAQVDNAEAVSRQAVVRKAAGINARIDVTRTLVELETQQQRLSSLIADLRKQKIALARLIGLPLDRELILSQPLRSTELKISDTGAAIQRAWQHRSDLKAAEAQVRAAEQIVSAAHAEYLPSVSLNGNYGVIGPNPARTHGVFAVTGSVNIPIWQGGRTKGDILQAESALHERCAELADQRARVEQDVRTALIELETASGQVRLAETNRQYANETLSEARDRFTAGVATTVEVVQAEEQVASAESDYISGLFSFDLAKLSLARATGDAETELPDLLKESRQ
jgi:outer membrane protein TolC